MPIATKAAAKKSATKKSATAKSASSKSAAKKKPSSTQHCWPGFEPTPGKAAGEKGSCQPKPGPQPKSVRRTDQKAAAAKRQGQGTRD
jgi:hypothetical protein